MTKISTQYIAQAIHDATLGKSETELAAILKNVTEFLDRKKMLGKMNEVLQKLEKIIHRDAGVIQVKVESVEKLSAKNIEELEKEILHRYKAKKVKFEISENKNLLGGIKIIIGDEVIDLTLRSKLHQLQNHLIKN